MNHSWHQLSIATPGSGRARTRSGLAICEPAISELRAPCSSLWPTSDIYSHIIGHRTLDDIEACQQSGGRSGSADADGSALFRNEALRSIVCALEQTPQSRRALTGLI